MKRTLALLSVAVLTASLAGTSVAAVKKPAPPKPVKLTYYFHGTNTVGNQDQALAVGTGLMKMDATKPSASGDKSFVFYGAGTSPNPNCAGNSLFPNWVGAASGTATGVATVTFYAQGSGTAKVQLFADTEAQACNDAYPVPLGEATIALPASAGKLTVQIPIIKTGKNPGKLASSFTVQLQAVLPVPSVNRVLYDSTASPSSVTITCIPKAGKKTC